VSKRVFLKHKTRGDIKTFHL